MPRQKRLDYHIGEINWSYGRGYGIRIPYLDPSENQAHLLC